MPKPSSLMIQWLMDRLVSKTSGSHKVWGKIVQVYRMPRISGHRQNLADLWKRSPPKLKRNRTVLSSSSASQTSASVANPMTTLSISLRKVEDPIHKCDCNCLAESSEFVWRSSFFDFQNIQTEFLVRIQRWNVLSSEHFLYARFHFFLELFSCLLFSRTREQVQKAKNLWCFSVFVSRASRWRHCCCQISGERAGWDEELKGKKWPQRSANVWLGVWFWVGYVKKKRKVCEERLVETKNLRTQDAKTAVLSPRTFQITQNYLRASAEARYCGFEISP